MFIRKIWPFLLRTPRDLSCRSTRPARAGAGWRPLSTGGGRTRISTADPREMSPGDDDDDDEDDNNDEDTSEAGWVVESDVRTGETLCLHFSRGHFVGLRKTVGEKVRVPGLKYSYYFSLSLSLIHYNLTFHPPGNRGILEISPLSIKSRGFPQPQLTERLWLKTKKAKAKRILLRSSFDCLCSKFNKLKRTLVKNGQAKSHIVNRLHFGHWICIERLEHILPR